MCKFLVGLMLYVYGCWSGTEDLNKKGKMKVSIVKEKALIKVVCKENVEKLT